jgi:malate dehydrogenase (oxaloacetate-decarboxylating)(NADP+)
LLPVHLPRRWTSARTTINEEMKLACVRAIADLALAEQSDIVAHAVQHRGPELRARNTLIPNAVRPRLIVQIAPRCRRAAMDSGVATPSDRRTLDAYRQKLTQFVYHLRPC